LAGDDVQSRVAVLHLSARREVDRGAARTQVQAVEVVQFMEVLSAVGRDGDQVPHGQIQGIAARADPCRGLQRGDRAQCFGRDVGAAAVPAVEDAPRLTGSEIAPVPFVVTSRPSVMFPAAQSPIVPLPASITEPSASAI
jgi:hypothetical protein